MSQQTIELTGNLLNQNNRRGGKMSFEITMLWSGYIGSSSVDTNKLKDSIEQILVVGKSVVVAAQRKLSSNS